MPETNPGPTIEQPRQRLRLTYAKGEAVKFISHHDEFRLWERTLRRANLPLLYKQGFNPLPHIQFAAPLGAGFTGAQEPVDIILSPPVALEEVAARLRAKLPPGVALLSLEEVAPKASALANGIIGADYTILLYAAPGELPAEMLETRIAAFLAQSVIWRKRERKGEAYTYNLRPLIYELRYSGYDAAAEEHRIFLRVQQRPGATGRPDEVVDALELDDLPRTLRRERLYFEEQAADVAIFAAYPVISQAEIAGPPALGKRVERGTRDLPDATAVGVHARSISERAGDEFV